MLAQLTATLNNWLYTYILVVLLIGAGLYFTVRTRFVQYAGGVLPGSAGEG